jgi:hypothetical protein
MCIVLFRWMPTGLADGLALKELRYVVDPTIRPVCGSPAPGDCDPGFGYLTAAS